jgi:hypothetical protein
MNTECKIYVADCSAEISYQLSSFSKRNYSHYPSSVNGVNIFHVQFLWVLCKGSRLFTSPAYQIPIIGKLHIKFPVAQTRLPSPFHLLITAFAVFANCFIAFQVTCEQWMNYRCLLQSWLFIISFCGEKPLRRRAPQRSLCRWQQNYVLCLSSAADNAVSPIATCQ